jgi:hypothetical protein
MRTNDPGYAPGTVIETLNRVDRVAGRGLRETERQARRLQRRRAGRPDVDAYDMLVARLTKAHQVEFKRIDWASIVADGLVAPAVARDAVSQVARRRLSEYRPSLMDALLGLEREKRRQLMEAVLEAGKADAELYARAVAAAEAHNRLLRLAPDVAQLKPPAIAGVLRGGAAVDAMRDVVEGFTIHLEGPQRLVGQLDLLEYDALPDESCHVVVAGAPPVFSNLTELERRELQIANACAMVLRAGVEMLQAAPVDSVEVVARLCRPGGQSEEEMDPVIYVKIPAAAFAKLQLAKMDAAPVVAAFGARIDWNPARGFAPVRIEDLGFTTVKCGAPKTERPAA